jgi:hypothetical protein
MTLKQKNSRQKTIIAPAGAAVKARIVSAGIRLGDLAFAAGFSGPSLSGYLTGRTCNPHGQIRIVRAFRRLTGRRISAATFWGDLWAESKSRQEDVA